MGLGPWLGRYVSPIPIRARGAFHLYATRTAKSDEPRVVVLAAPDADPEDAAECLREVARAHASFDVQGVPRVAETGARATPFVAFACDAVLDLEHLIARASDGEARTTYACGAGFVLGLMQALSSVHQATGGDVCLGALVPSNILFAPDGTHWLIGFGHHLCGKRPGQPAAQAGVFQAPEVAAGGRATPGADLYAVTMFLRSLLGFVELPAPARRVFEGRPQPEDAELVRLLLWSNQRIVAAVPHERPSFAEALAMSRRVWAELRLTPDAPGYARWVAGVIARDAEAEEIADGDEQPELVSSRALVIGPDADWIRTPQGAKVRLGPRRALRRLVLALAIHWRDHRTSTLDVSDLLDAGWPGEQPIPEAGANRVYVALSTLRKLGLADLLERHGDGYRLDPATPVLLAANERRAKG